MKIDNNGKITDIEGRTTTNVTFQKIIKATVSSFLLSTLEEDFAKLVPKTKVLSVADAPFSNEFLERIWSAIEFNQENSSKLCFGV